MDTILFSWLDSLKIIYPKNAIQFLQVVLKTFLSLYAALITTFWWLFLGALIIILFIKTHGIVLIGSLILWLLLLILAARPSLKHKDFMYFADNVGYGFPLALLFLIPCCVSTIAVSVLAPWLIMTMFFLCDSNFVVIAMMKAPVRAGMMLIYKLPLYMIFIGFFYASTFLPWFLNVATVIPLLIAALSCCYTIWLHAYYGDYCEGRC